ncbi:hypothetical protein ABQE89_25535 [Mycolicibacterium sp. XJ1819]
MSLTSLLSAQTGELKAEVVSAMSLAEEAQLSSAVSGNAGLLKGQINSKYQTTNSQSTQTTRKANVQSLFRDFRDNAESDLVLKVRSPTERDLGRKRHEVLSDPNLCFEVDHLERGRLVEVTVELEADPVFRVSTMLSEIFDLSVEHPELLGTSSLPPEMAQMVRVFERLLTGLIPVRGRSVDLCVFTDQNKQFVAKKPTLDWLGLEGVPLTIVGVTEHLSFWRDIRRVLFSRSRFTLLCRIDRDGLHQEWTPVKLSDVFADVVPELGNLSGLMNSMSETLLTATPVKERQDPKLADALRCYATDLVNGSGAVLSDQDVTEMERLIGHLSRQEAGDVATQRSAFDAMSSLLGVDLTPQEAVRHRREARRASGLSLLPEQSSHISYRDPPTSHSQQALLDTEVIAIYW